MLYDTVIIGAGPAALQAALFLGRAGLKPLVIGKPFESDLAYAHSVQNVFGISEMSGKDIVNIGINQLKDFMGELIEEDVVHVWQESNTKESDIIRVRTSSDKEFGGKTLLIATGKPYVHSGIENENKFRGKGVHYCVACDGPFFAKKKVVVIGNTDFAAEEALELMSYTQDITIISNGFPISFSDAFKKKIGSVKVIDTKVRAFEGNKMLRNIILDDGQSMEFDGAFVALGAATSLAFSDKMGIEKNGEDLIINRNGETSVKNVYAAGGCTGGYLQVAKSIGEGCNAAISIIKSLKGLETYADQT